jgi:predicted amidohydrolase
MDAEFGAPEHNRARATGLIEDAAGQGAQLVVLPELFSSGYRYTDQLYSLMEPLAGPTAIWIADTARRLGVHLVGSYPARTSNGNYIVAMLAAPDGRHWLYRKVHVAMWENCYFHRGSEPVIANTELGRIGLLICWDQVFTDLARAYQGRADLLCIPSSPPTFVGAVEDSAGRILAETDRLELAGREVDSVGWFNQAQVAHAQTCGVPVVYSARCGQFQSQLPYGAWFLLPLGARAALRILRRTGTGFRLRCAMMGRSRILNATGQALADAAQDGEAVLVAPVQPGAPDPATLPPAPRRRSLVPVIPALQLFFDDSWITLGRWHRWRHQPKQSTVNDQSKQGLES